MTSHAWLAGLLPARRAGNAIAAALIAQPWPVLPLVLGSALAVLASAVWISRRHRAAHQAGADAADVDAGQAGSSPDPPPDPAVPPPLRGDLPAPADGPPGACGDLPGRAPFIPMDLFAAAPLRPAADTGIRAPDRPDDRLRIECSALRFTLTLGHAALQYRLDLVQRGGSPLGPLIIRAALIAAGPDMAQAGLAAIAGDDLPICHYLDGLAVGGRGAVSGELQMAIGQVPVFRLGRAQMLVPVLRLWVESLRDAPVPLRCPADFAIGQQTAPGDTIQPFELGTATAIWRRLAARRLADGQIGRAAQLPLDGGSPRY